MTHATLVSHRDAQSVVGAILRPQYLISTLHWFHCSSRDFKWLEKCPPGKQTMQLIFS